MLQPDRKGKERLRSWANHLATIQGVGLYKYQAVEMVAQQHVSPSARLSSDHLPWKDSGSRKSRAYQLDDTKEMAFKSVVHCHPLELGGK